MTTHYFSTHGCSAGLTTCLTFCPVFAVRLSKKLMLAVDAESRRANPPRLVTTHVICDRHRDLRVDRPSVLTSTSVPADIPLRVSRVSKWPWNPRQMVRHFEPTFDTRSCILCRPCFRLYAYVVWRPSISPCINHLSSTRSRSIQPG